MVSSTRRFRTGATRRPGCPCGASTARRGGPPAEMLAGVDTLVFDIQDVGVRYYTYLATLVYVLEEARRAASSRASCSIGPIPSPARSSRGR